MHPSRTKLAAGRPRDPAVDDAILDAALALFAEGGLEMASIDRIARKAGVTRATVYRRWSSRERLIAFAIGRVRETAEQSFGDWETLPLDVLLERFIALAPKLMTDPAHRRLLAQAIRAAPSAPEIVAVYWEAFLKPRRDGFARLLAVARAQGHLQSTITPDLLEDMLGGALLHRLLLEPGEPTEAELRTYLRRLFAALGLPVEKTATEHAR